MIGWLLQKADRAECNETWNLTMEAAITVFVLVSMVIEIVNLVRSLPIGGLYLARLPGILYIFQA